MPSFPSRHSGKHKQTFGWEKKEIVHEVKPGSITKFEQKKQKKMQVLQEQKQIREQRKSYKDAIKVVGLVPMQPNLQLKKVFESSFGQAIQFLGSETVVVKSDHNLLTFIELENLEQAFSVDCLLFCAIDDEFGSAQLDFIDKLNIMKIPQIPHQSLMLHKQELLSILLKNNFQSQTQKFSNQLLKNFQVQTNQDPKPFSLQNANHKVQLETFFQNIVFEKPVWLQKRMILNILAERRTLENNEMVIEVIGQAHGPYNTQQNVFLSNYGDQLEVTSVSQCQFNFEQNTLIEVPLQLKGQFEPVKMNLSTSAPNEIVTSAQEEVMNEQPVDETYDPNIDPSYQDFTLQDQTDLSSVIDCQPIQMDYEFKKTQFKTVEEQIQYPDEIDIHPESSLSKLLKEYFSVKSLRNSPLPVGQGENHELNSIFHLKQPTQTENVCTKINSDYNQNSILKFTLRVRNNNDHFLQMMNQVKQNVPNMNQNYEQLVQRLQPEYFQNVPLRNLSLISLFEHETKYGLAHVKVLPQEYVKFQLQSYSIAEIQVGFRKLMTIATPYQQVAQYRGKLLRYFGNTNELMLSFVSPIFITKSAFPPVIVSYSQQQNMIPDIQTEKPIELKAKLVQYNSQIQVLERLVLTGWPHKIHRNQSIIRYMFFNQKDVRFFINQCLTTRNGLNGKILSTVTEKGYFKAHFDGQLSSGDCVEMKLYKLLLGCGLSMGCSYEMNQGINMSGYAAFEEIFQMFRSLMEQVLTRLREVKYD
ncbi:Ribosome_biogenesis protein [Hexamita inflata]|uniref:Ribosome_biogenesis protein n=1 Tax=Hexamita inflata TaxID=28002 RepID=A0ABP1KR72_9EUKA